MKRISVVIPALNEAGSIGDVVGEMPWDRIAECIVVDNGSTDGTATIAAAAGARVIESARGYGAACKAGSDAALASSDIVVFMDGDGSDLIADLDRLAGPIERGQRDFVIGSRLRGAREPGSMLPGQLFANWLVGRLVWRIHRFRYTDMGPFRAIRKTSLEQLQMSEMTYGWNLEMQVKAVLCGLRIEEIAVDYRRRIAGDSKVSGNLIASARTAVRIMHVLYRASFARRSELPR